MTHPGKLFFLCGKMGAGKSTWSVKLANQENAVLISEDEWLARHYPEQIHDFADYLKYAKQIKPFIYAHIVQILGAGANVVMDFPANTKRQRQWFVKLCNDHGFEHQMAYVDCSDAQCLQHIEKRRLENPERAKFDTKEIFYQVSQYFEPPEDAEEINTVLLGHNY